VTAERPHDLTLFLTLRAWIQVLLRSFFHHIEVTGLENIPSDRGGILVSWHPNGLIDPGLILATFPHRVVFGARDGLFRWPGRGALMRGLGTVPIYRAVDAGAVRPADRRDANRQSLDALAHEVSSGAFSALFPEGASHDEPGLVELKAGAARLYYRARALGGQDGPPPVVLPVGLHYDRKNRFRSRALVAFHPPMAVPKALDVTPSLDETDTVTRDRARALTLEIERVLEDVVGATEDWATRNVLMRVSTLVRAEHAARAGTEPEPSLLEQVSEFTRVRRLYYALRGHDAGEVAKVRAWVEHYDARLRDLGLEDEDLDRNPALVSPWLAWLLVLQMLVVFLVLPPVLLLGVLVNAPAALTLRAASRLGATYRKDEATIKVLGGAVLYPLTWIAAGVLSTRVHERLDAAYALPDTKAVAGVWIAVLSAVGGMIALRYLRVARQTARALRVRLTKWQRLRSLTRLRAQRTRLYDRLVALSRSVGDSAAAQKDTQ
jgi:1-acyl-sn-glycerol-3-phosphate acyltransferase